VGKLVSSREKLILILALFIPLAFRIGVTEYKAREVRPLGTPDLEVAPIHPGVGFQTVQSQWRRIFLCVNQVNDKEDFSSDCPEKIKERMASGLYDVALFTTVAANPYAFPWKNSGWAYDVKGERTEVARFEDVIDREEVELIHSYYGGFSNFPNAGPSLASLRAIYTQFSNARDVRHTHNSLESYRETDRKDVEPELHSLAQGEKTIVLCGNRPRKGEEKTPRLCTAVIGYRVTTSSK